MNQLARSPKQVGAIIQNARQEKGMSQTELANLAGTRQSMISIMEGGNPGMKLATLCDLLVALDLEMTIGPRSKSSTADIQDIF